MHRGLYRKAFKREGRLWQVFQLYEHFDPTATVNIELFAPTARCRQSQHGAAFSFGAFLF